MIPDVNSDQAIGKVLFLAHRSYIIGISKLHIPVKFDAPPPLERYRPYVATLFGGPQHSQLTFCLRVKTLRGHLMDLCVKGGDM